MWKEIRAALAAMPAGVYHDPANPEAPFRTMMIGDYLKQHALRIESLDKSEKKKLLIALYKEGAFNTKNAASYVADVLQISRATVYNYLKDKS